MTWVIPDTDIWYAVFDRHAPAPRLVHRFSRLVRERRILLLGPIRQRLLQAVRSGKPYLRLEAALARFPEPRLQAGDFVRAGLLGHRARAAGTAAGDGVYLAWAVAERCGASIWSQDASWQPTVAAGCPWYRPEADEAV